MWSTIEEDAPKSTSGFQKSTFQYITYTGILAHRHSEKHESGEDSPTFLRARKVALRNIWQGASMSLQGPTGLYQPSCLCVLSFSCLVPSRAIQGCVPTSRSSVNKGICKNTFPNEVTFIKTCHLWADAIQLTLHTDFTYCKVKMILNGILLKITENDIINKNRQCF